VFVGICLFVCLLKGASIVQPPKDCLLKVSRKGSVRRWSWSNVMYDPGICLEGIIFVEGTVLLNYVFLHLKIITRTYKYRTSFICCRTSLQVIKVRTPLCMDIFVLVEYWTASIQYEGSLWVKPEEVGLRGNYTV